MEDDQNNPQAQPLDTVLFHLVDEPEDVPTAITDEEVAEPPLIPTTDPIEELFDQGFGDHDGEDHQVYLTNEDQLPAAPALVPSVSVLSGKKENAASDGGSPGENISFKET